MFRMISLATLLLVCLLTGCTETKQFIVIEVEKDVWTGLSQQGHPDANIRASYKLELTH